MKVKEATAEATTATEAPTTAIAIYTETEKGLALLKLEADITKFDLSTTAGFDAAKVVRRGCVSLRTGVEALRLAANAPLNKRIKANKTEADLLVLEIGAIEAPFDEAIKAVEAAKELVREEKAQAAAKRVADITARIDQIRAFPLSFVGMDALQMAIKIAQIEAAAIGVEFAELAETAEKVRGEVVLILKETLAKQEIKEADDLRIRNEQAAETVRLETLQKEQTRVNALRDGIRQIQDWPRTCFGMSATVMTVMMAGFPSVTAVDFSEFQEEAEQAERDSLAEVQRMIDAATVSEAAANKLLADQLLAADAERERNRVNTIKDMITVITAWPIQCIGLSAVYIRSAIEGSEMALDVVAGDCFQEFAAEAEEARVVALAKMNEMLTAAETAETEAARLETQRVEQAAAQKVLDDAAEATAEAERVAAKKVADKKKKASPVEVAMVSIPQAEYDSLIKDSEFLQALQQHGVDNWPGYGDACAEVREAA